MKTQEIPKSQWTKFFNEFSRTHLGQQTNLWVCSSDAGLAREAVGLPLIGVCCDKTSSGHQRIDIIIGDSTQANVTHQVQKPTSVRIATSSTGRESTLEIKSQDGTIAFVRLQLPAASTTPAAFA